MEVLKTLKPGQPGTQKLLEHYGDNLIAVRYRMDESTDQQVTTIEIIVDESIPASANTCPATASPRHQYMQAIRIDYKETELRQAIKGAGGRWDKSNKVWWLQHEAIQSLRLPDRVVEGLECPYADTD